MGGGDVVSKWIKEQHSRGFSKEEIYESMIKHGYSAKQADKALDKVKLPDGIPNVPKAPRPSHLVKPKKSHLWLYIVVILILVGGTLGVFYFVPQDVFEFYFPPSEECMEGVDCTFTEGDVHTSVTEEDGVTSIRVTTDPSRECWFEVDCSGEDSCIDGKCLNPVNVGECNDFDSFDKYECIKHVAVNKLDVSLCKALNLNPDSYSSIEVDCYLEIALALDDDTPCDTLIDLKTTPSKFECYKHYAVLKTDMLSCESIDYERGWQDCIWRVNESINHPEIETGDFITLNWLGLAKQTNDENYCEYETSFFTKRDCYEYFGIET